MEGMGPHGGRADPILGASVLVEGRALESVADSGGGAAARAVPFFPPT